MEVGGPASLGWCLWGRMLYFPRVTPPPLPEIFSLGWCVLVAAGIEHVRQRWASWRSPLLALLVGLLLVSSARTVSRNTVWRSREALFRWVRGHRLEVRGQGAHDRGQGRDELCMLHNYIFPLVSAVNIIEFAFY